jgi:hypothetical protein
MYATASERAASLVEVHADPEDVHNALREAAARRRESFVAYQRLGFLLDSGGWSIPENMPPSLERLLISLEGNYVASSQMIFESEEKIARWLDEQSWRHAEQQFFAARSRTEKGHLRGHARRRRRRQRGG